MQIQYFRSILYLFLCNVAGAWMGWKLRCKCDMLEVCCTCFYVMLQVQHKVQAMVQMQYFGSILYLFLCNVAGARMGWKWGWGKKKMDARWGHCVQNKDSKELKRIDFELKITKPFSPSPNFSSLPFYCRKKNFIDIILLIIGCNFDITAMDCLLKL